MLVVREYYPVLGRQRCWPDYSTGRTHDTQRFVDRCSAEPRVERGTMC